LSLYSKRMDLFSINFTTFSPNNSCCIAGLRHHGIAPDKFQIPGYVPPAKMFCSYYLTEFIDTYAFYFQLRSIDPATRAPWTPAVQCILRFQSQIRFVVIVRHHNLLRTFFQHTQTG
jgi:hypothetical protein